MHGSDREERLLKVIMIESLFAIDGFAFLHQR